MYIITANNKGSDLWHQLTRIDAIKTPLIDKVREGFMLPAFKGADYAFNFLVLCSNNSWNNFGVKAAEIADRKLIRIALIRINLRSLRSTI